MIFRCEAAGVDWSWSYTPGNIGLMVGPVITGNNFSLHTILLLMSSRIHYTFSP